MTNTLFMRIIVPSIALLCCLNPAHAEYVMTEGKGWRFCEALLKELKHYAPKKMDHCPVLMLRKLPGVTEPEWKELDINQHEGLLRKLVIYQNTMNDYFDPERREAALERFKNSFGPIEKRVNEEIRDVRKGRSRLKVAKVNLLHADPHTGSPDPAPETLVRRTYEWEPPLGWSGDDARECRQRYHSNDDASASDFLVKDDLSDVDQRNPDAIFFGSSLWNMVLFYEGKDYLVHYDPSGNGFTVMRDAHDSGYVGTVCSIIHTIPKSSKGKRK